MIMLQSALVAFARKSSCFAHFRLPLSQLGFRAATSQAADVNQTEKAPKAPSSSTPPSPSSTATVPAATTSEKSHPDVEKNGVVFKKGAQPIETPTPEGEEKIFSPKITQLVDGITRLTLVEISELNEALKKRLNLPDFSAMSYAPHPAAATSETSTTEAKLESKKTSFKVKLVRFDEKKKIPLIKEVKTLVPGLNLVQAKKFVESLPQVLKEDIGETEAETLKKAIEAVGGVCEIE